jgi:hypothetical protein
MRRWLRPHEAGCLGSDCQQNERTKTRRTGGFFIGRKVIMSGFQGVSR